MFHVSQRPLIFSAYEFQPQVARSFYLQVVALATYIALVVVMVREEVGLSTLTSRGMQLYAQSYSERHLRTFTSAQS